jgi:hypothetical protein
VSVAAKESARHTRQYQSSGHSAQPRSRSRTPGARGWPSSQNCRLEPGFPARNPSTQMSVNLDSDSTSHNGTARVAFGSEGRPPPPAKRVFRGSITHPTQQTQQSDAYQTSAALRRLIRQRHTRLRLWPRFPGSREARREFSCNPSEQFEVLTWCQKTRHDSVLPNQQPRPIQLTGDPATSPEAQEGASDQTLQTIQSASGSGATHIVRVEKPQPADETTRIEATPATGAEISNHDTEDARVGEPTDAHAVVFPAAGKPATMPCPEPRRRQ